MSAAEWAAAADEARAAIAWSIANGHHEKAAAPAALAVERHTLGVAAELAFAAMTGLTRSGLIVSGQWLRRADFPNGIEIRSAFRPGARLWVRAEDADANRYVLVERCAPATFEAIGWLYGAEAKVDRYWRRLRLDRPPSYFVPASALRPMTELAI